MQNNTVVHNNLRDSSWSMFKRNDIKHIRNDKVAKFAGNIIGALKKAYGISNKSELFYETLSTPQNREQPRPHSNFATRFTRLAGYDYKSVNQPKNKCPPVNKEIFDKFQEAMMEYAFQHSL